MQTINDIIRTELFSLQDLAYRDFHSALMPTVDKDRVVGVRTPLLRKYSKVLAKQENIDTFLFSLPHKFYEENNIHAFIIQAIKNFDECISELETFLPYIDNWATCDMLRPACFKNNTDKLFAYVIKWMSDDRAYVVRFAIGILNSYYMDNAFDETHLRLVCGVKSDDYYVKMMIAWYFATALTFHYYDALPYLEKCSLDAWIHNMIIRKAVESYRICDERKAYLKTLRL